MTNNKTTVEEIIEIIKPDEIYVKISNYLQCIVDNEFKEFQKCYINKCWVEIQTNGPAISPSEDIIKLL